MLNPDVAAAAERRPEDQTPAQARSGSLRFAAQIDADADLATNPTATTPVPVARIGGVADPAKAVYYATITLAAEAVPAQASQSPAGTPVTFRLWNTETRTEIVREATADAWGAAYIEILLDDQHIQGRYSYRASAPGFGDTGTRTFALDTARYSSDVRLGAARLSTHVEADGRLIVDVESDLAIDEAALATQISAVRLVPASTKLGVPERELLPPLVARRLDDRHARAEIYLDNGEYLFAATATSGTITAQSGPALVSIKDVKTPPVGAVERIGDLAPDGKTALVQYRTPNGDAALMRRGVDNLPAPMFDAPDAPGVFKQTTRLGAFSWRTDTYTITTQIIANDHKKIATLDGFSYDPIARRYDIKIESLIDKPVDDKLTVEVLGPNGVVIYNETAPIRLDPAQPLHYQVSVPTDRGEPYGLRIIVHDPLGLEWLIQKTGEAITAVFNALASVAPIEDGFTLTAGFKGSLKIVGIDVISASILCALGNGCQTKQGGLIFKPGDWVDIVTTGVRDYLRSQFGANSIDEALGKFLLKGIELGSVSLSATLGARYTKNLFDPVKCPDPESIERAKEYIKALGRNLKEVGIAITFKFKKLSEKFQGKAFADLPVPGLWFLGVSLSPILAFKLEGGTSGDFGVYGQLAAEIGVKGSLVLNGFSVVALLGKLLDMKDLVVGLYQSVETIKTAEQIFKLISAAVKQTAASKNCDPPPPDGSPDDRLDAFQNEFLPTPTGGSGKITYIQQQIATANRLGFSRAVTYWTLQLREQELAAFTADTTRALSTTAELDSIFAVAQTRIQGIISGTITLPPTQTITDAVQLTYIDTFDHVGNTSYDAERRGLLDSLSFAQRRYNELQGQELDLQRELRLMAQGGGVGVLDGGLVTWALAAIGSVGIDAKPVQIVPGLTSSNLPDSRYYSPYEAPPVLLVPSGALNRYEPSQQARSWLDTFVSAGGTLIVLAQADSTDWDLLPGGAVEGLGYNQDILCKTASVRIVNPSPWIVGINRDLPDIQVDGSFTAWPANASVTLMRTTGNQMPAMIEYPYGNGHVVATSTYPDFYINGMQSEDDIVFARSLFGLAYLEGTGQTAADTTQPGQQATIALQVTNTAAVTATQITVWGDYYSSHVAESWRWAAHQPYQLRASQVVNLTPSLPSGSSREVTFSFTAPSQAGLFRTGYFLGAADRWWNSGAIPGPFYQVQSATVASPLPGFRLQQDQDMYSYGETATITATLRNNQATVRTFVLEALSGLDAAPVSLIIGPNASAEHVYTTPVYERREVRIGVREDDRTLSRLVTTLRLRPPTLGVNVTPGQVVAGLDTTARIAASVTNVGAGTPIAWELRRDGMLINTLSTPLVAGPGYTSASTDISLPAAAPDSTYTIRAALPGNTLVMTQTVPVRSPAIIRGTTISGPLTIGAANPGAISAVIVDLGHAGTADVQASVRQGTTTLASGPVVTLPIGGGVQTATLGVTLPASLDLNQRYTLVVNATSRVTGATASYDSSFSLPLPLQAPAAALLESTRTVRQPLTLQLTPLPGSVALPAVGPYAVTLRGITVPFTQSLEIAQATPVDGRLQLTTSVPNLLRGGVYQIDVQSPRLSNWRATADWRVPAHQLAYAAPATASAGGTLAWTARNTGGVDTHLTGTLNLADTSGMVLAQTPVDVALAPAETQTVSLDIPAQLSSGRYTLRWRGFDHLNQPAGSTHVLMLDGIAVTLESRTDRPDYLTSDSVSTSSAINASSTLSDASLRLQVLKSVGDWVGWRAQGGDGGHTNTIPPVVTSPLTSTWNLTTNYTGIGPVAVGDLVLTAFNNGGQHQLLATDSTTGGVRWRLQYGAPPKELGANTSHAYVLTTGTTVDSGLIAVDVRSGERRWFRPITSGERLVVSDAAVAVYSLSARNFQLLDPVTGAQRGIIPADHDIALMVDNTLYVQNGGNAIAYDATTAAERWRSPLTPSATLLSADRSHVIGSASSDSNTIMYVYNAETGAFIRNITVGSDVGTPPPQTTPLRISGSPLAVQVYNTTQVSVQYGGLHQFYGQTASGVYVVANNRLYGPPSVPAGNSANAYTLISNTGPTGSGTIADPWVITARLALPGTTLQMTVLTTYIQGNTYYGTDISLTNTDPSNPVSYRVFHAADLYPSNPRGTQNDFGFGYYDQSSGAVGAYQNDPWFQLFVPITPASAYREATYFDIWRAIGTSSAPGPGFNNTIRTDYVDAGAGLQWNGTLAGGGTTLIQDRLRFDSDPVSTSPVLRGNTLYYLVSRPGSSGVASTIYAVDLATGGVSSFYQRTGDLRAMVATGDLLYLVDRSNRALITLNSAGTEIATRSLSTLVNSANLDSLAVSDQGLLVSANGGANVNALQASNRLAGNPNGQTTVLREVWLDVNGGSQTLTQPFTDLANDTRARGSLYLAGTLFSYEPADAPMREDGQVLARSLYPFTISESSAAVALTTDRATYRANRPGYAADDAASTVTLSGKVRNTSPLASPITLSLQRDDGTTIHSQTFADVAPGEERQFTATDLTPPTGPVTYTATSDLGGQASARITIRPGVVSALPSVTPAEIALGERATLQVALTNDGSERAFVTADLGAGPQVADLAVGEVITLTRVLTATSAGQINLPVTLAGDLSRNDPVVLTVRDETASAALALTGRTRDASTLVQGDDVGLALTLTNVQPFSFDAIVDYTITGPEERTGSELRTLTPGDTTLAIGLGALPAGTYTTNFTVRHPRLDAPITSISRTFSVVAPQYALTLDASAGAPDSTGNAQFQIQAANATTSDGAWTGRLVLSGAIESSEALTLAAGGGYTSNGTLSLANRAGEQTIEVALVNPDGTVAQHRALQINAAPRLAPQATLSNFRATRGSAGGNVMLTATVTNNGPAGEAPLTLVAFDQTYERLSTLAAGQSDVTFSVPTPADLLAGSYPALIRMGDQELRTDIVLEGIELSLRQRTNANSYSPFSQATWTVELTGGRGGPASYDVSLRYGSAEYSRTVTIDAGQTVATLWTFDVGPTSGRATVLVTTRPVIPTESRHTVLIDSQWISVIDDDRAYLESDKGSYNAGETVDLTLHLTRPADAALVLAPDELAGSAGPLIWTSLVYSNTATVRGDFTMSYTLPGALPTGRYFFRYTFDGEERSLPIDVFGVALKTENLTARGPVAGGPLADGDALAISADLRLDKSVSAAEITAYTLAPDGTYAALGSGATLRRSLPAGVTSIALNGVLDVVAPGAHQIVLKVRDAASGIELGGDAVFVDVGRAVIGTLTTDRGLYTPGQAGTGTVTLFGTGRATVRVTTSSGTALLDQNLSLTGDRELSFSLPTATVGDEVLIASVTDSSGLASSLQAAYKVAARLDTTPPQVQIVSPANGALVTFTSSNHLLTVSGVVTEETALDALLVNGERATLNGTAWSATIRAENGLNMIQVAALDRAGNVGLADLLTIVGAPSYAITLSATPVVARVGDVITYQAVATSTDVLTGTTLFPFSAEGVLPLNGSATSGSFTVSGTSVKWNGVVRPDAPVTIQWTGRATAPANRTIYAVIQGPQMPARQSNSVRVQVSGNNQNSAPVVGPITARLDPVPVNQAIATSAGFTDANAGDTHTASWDWDDGITSAGTVTEANGAGSVSGSHTYTAAGVYTIRLTVSDNAGASGQSVFEYVVVYDPSAEFVTGGGWINSPAGAYTPDPTITGHANFGFVSKYQHGATEPSGQTEFQLKGASLNFQSTIYQWLVIAGSKAQYKGSGTINGRGDYGFLLTAVDGQSQGGAGADKFRIKIWDKATNAVIYDNQIGAADTATPSTVIGSGSIVIH